MLLSIIIPVYNEETLVCKLLEKVVELRLEGGMEKEIIVVDDGSSDKTHWAISRYIAACPGANIQLLAHKSNHGKGAAVRTGMAAAAGDIWIILDADLEYDPEDIKDIALVRVEQLYPYPEEDLAALLKKYASVADLCWCQEEPENQGAWFAIQPVIRRCMQLGQTLYFAGRSASAAPSGGHLQKHLERQKRLINAALALEPVPRGNAVPSKAAPSPVPAT